MFHQYIKRISVVFALSILICMSICTSNTLANSYIAFETCDQDGDVDLIGSSFNQATIVISDLDTSGNYTYYGADVGAFEAPVSNISTPVYTKRIATNSLSFQVTDFGDVSQYQNGKTYVLGYRVLYQPVGDNGLNVVESSWKMVPDSYFTISPYSPFVTCDNNGKVRVSDKAFSQASITTGDLDVSGNYTYYGADVGIFQKPLALNTSNVVYTKRFTTKALSFKITDFGDLSKYQYDQVYVLGYRMLYQTVGDNGLNVTESSWKMVPNSYFRLMPKNLQHVQTIRYVYNSEFKAIDVKGADESGLQGNELTAYNTSNFATEGDLLTYKVKFNLSDLSKWGNLDANLLLNILDDPDIELVLSSAQINGNNIDLTNAKKAQDDYVLNIPGSGLVEGDNYLTYTARLKVYNYTRIFVNITNNATITGTTTDGSSLQIGTPFSPSSNVQTKVFKGEVRYH